jgi:VWFA-related protein
MWFRIVFCLGLLIVASGLVAADGPQEAPPPAATPKFTSHAELVMVPALVTDKSGAHVTGLTAPDFTVTEDGVPQKVTVFEEVKAGGAPVTRDQGGAFTNVAADSTAPQRTNIILIDQLNTRFQMQVYAKDRLIKYVQQYVKSGNKTAILVFRGTHLLLVRGFTDNPDSLITALDRVWPTVAPGTTSAVGRTPMPTLGSPTPGLSVGAGRSSGGASRGPVGESGSASDVANIQNRTQALRQAEQALGGPCSSNVNDFSTITRVLPTLELFRVIARSFAGIPGRKALIWITGGFPFCTAAGQLHAGAQPQLYENTFNMLNDANIAVYPIDANGLVAEAEARNWPRLANFDAFHAFAESTGGRAYLNRNDLDRGAAEAAADAASYYVLGYYRTQHETDRNGWRKLNVKVARGGTRVRARAGFFVTNKMLDDAAIVRNEIASAVVSPFDFTSLALSVRWTGTGGSSGAPKRNVDFSIAIPPGALTLDDSDRNHANLQVLAFVRTTDERVVTQSNQQVDGHLSTEQVSQLGKEGFTYSGHLEVPSGDYNVRFVVRDNISGRIGSVQAPLKVE